MSAKSTGYRLVRRVGQQGTRPSVLSQAGVGKYATGCESLSLRFQHVTRNIVFGPKFLDNTTCQILKHQHCNTKIRTLSCYVKLANSFLEAMILHLDVLALQEVRCHGTGTVEFDNGDIKGWQFVWSGNVRMERT